MQPDMSVEEIVRRVRKESPLFDEPAPTLFRKGSFSQQLKENKAGAGYFACNIAWFAAGYLTSGIGDIDLYAGLTNFVGSTARLKINPEYEFLGAKNWDRRIGASAGAASTAISTSVKAAAAFATGDLFTFGGILFNDALIATAQYVDFNSGTLQSKDFTPNKNANPVMRMFQRAKHLLLKNPSATAGLGRALSRGLPIALLLASGNIPVAAVYVALAGVDLYYMGTKAVTEYRKAKAQATQPVEATPTTIKAVHVPFARTTIMPPETAASLSAGIQIYKAQGQHSRRAHIVYARSLRSRPVRTSARHAVSSSGRHTIFSRRRAHTPVA